MGDCDNVMIRELLPDYAAGTLETDARSRVDAHLASCALCRDELALLATARRALQPSVSIDTARIARGVVAATATGQGRRVPGRGRATRWPAVRLAASVALAAAGLATFGVWQKGRITHESDTLAAVTMPALTARAAALAPVGGLAELNENQLNTLLDDIASFEAAPAAEPADIVPTFVDPTAEEIQ